MADIPAALGVLLSLHEPLEAALSDGSAAPAVIHVELDRDSSVSPKPWVVMTFTDKDNDATTIKLSAQEAMQLSKRLSAFGSAIL